VIVRKPLGGLLITVLLDFAAAVACE